MKYNLLTILCGILLVIIIFYKIYVLYMVQTQNCTYERGLFTKELKCN